jgi:hypothetical protein
VFETAREIYNERSKVGLLSFKNSPVNDELVIAMALEVCGVKTLSFQNGKAMNTIYGQTGNLENINVLEGQSNYVREGMHTEPIAIHYGVGVQKSFIYLRELYRLELDNFASHLTKLAGILTSLECLRDRLEVKYTPNRANPHKAKAVSWRDKNGLEVEESLPAQVLQCLTYHS